MTGNEVLKISLNILFDDTKEYDSSALYFINLIIPELFETENGIRRTEGREELKEIPFLSDMESLIPYCDRLTRGTMPYGLASQIAMDDDNFDKAGYYRQLYVNAVNSYTKVMPEAVVDCYE